MPFFDGGWWSIMYNLGDEITPITDWVLDFLPITSRGIWEDIGTWYDTETWYDNP